MCNRYANRGSVAQIRQLAALMDYDLATTSATDNLPAMDDIKTNDYDAPVIRNDGDKKLLLTMMRWGIEQKPPKAKDPTYNIRNLKSRWWGNPKAFPPGYITEAQYRCLVPFTAFAEPAWNSTWFMVKDVEVACFAGLWRTHTCARLVEQAGKKRRAREDADWELYAFLTTEANELVRPIHEKAMPVILTDPDDMREWLGGGEVSLRLQKPFSAGEMTASEEYI